MLAYGEIWITIDPNNLFSAKPPRQDGLLDEVVNGNWYKKTYEECQAIASDDNVFDTLCYSVL